MNFKNCVIAIINYSVRFPGEEVDTLLRSIDFWKIQHLFFVACKLNF